MSESGSGASNARSSATKNCSSGRMEAGSMSESASCGCNKALNRYKCKNCGAIHEGESAPGSCMKCDCNEFRRI